MRASRLLSILITLQLRGQATAASLAERFEVSLRTIYRDVDALSAAGIPVYADRGPGGGFKLLDGYRTQLTGFTDAEAEGLLFSALPGAAAELGLGQAASAARLKLLAALPAAAGAGALRIADRFHLDPVDWYQRIATPERLGAVAQGVWTGRRLRMRYESWEKVAERLVDPLGLVLKAGIWYLVARARNRTATYRISNIQSAELIDQAVERPSGFDLARTWREHVGRFEASLRRGSATLLVADAAMCRIGRLGADMAEAIRAAPLSHGRRRATVPIEGIAHAAGLLLAFAEEIEVVEPEALRRELATRAAKIVSLYAGPSGSRGRLAKRRAA